MATAAEQCANNPYSTGTSYYNDYVNRYQCWLYDSSIPGPSSEPSYAPEETTTASTSVAYETAPGTTTGPIANKDVVKGLQNALNKFYGISIGAPISVDGAVGNETLNAVQATIQTLPGIGFDSYVMTSLVGDPPTIASISASAAALSDVLDWIAGQKAYTEGVTPGGDTPSAPSVPAIRTPRGLAPAVPIPRESSQKTATTFLGLGLPDWAFYAAGGVVALGVAALVVKRLRTKR